MGAASGCPHCACSVKLQVLHFQGCVSHRKWRQIYICAACRSLVALRYKIASVTAGMYGIVAYSLATVISELPYIGIQVTVLAAADSATSSCHPADDSAICSHIC